MQYKQKYDTNNQYLSDNENEYLLEFIENLNKISKELIDEKNKIYKRTKRFLCIIS